MRQRRVRAVFMRGGTSKAVMLRRADLPQDEAQWPALFRAMLGSPDPYGRQLDGMGGGLSSLSKICVISPSQREDADVDYTFAQVAVSGDEVDLSGNCGNMSSAVGPFALDEGLVDRPAAGEALVRIFNTNSGKIIHSSFPVEDGEASIGGDLVLPGIATPGAPVKLEFIHPAGTRGRGLLPAGAATTRLEPESWQPVEASLVDAAIPCVFVRATDLGADAAVMPDQLDANRELLTRLEAIRRAASVVMGLAADLREAGERIAIPKIAMVGAAAAYETLAGEPVDPRSHDLCARMISAGQAHRAFPITGSLAIASAAAIPGSVVADCLDAGADRQAIRLGTPSGIITVGTRLAPVDGREPSILSASILRTQRRLFEGAITIPAL